MVSVKTGITDANKVMDANLLLFKRLGIEESVTV